MLQNAWDKQPQASFWQLLKGLQIYRPCEACDCSQVRDDDTESALAQSHLVQ